MAQGTKISRLWARHSFYKSKKFFGPSSECHEYFVNSISSPRLALGFKSKSIRIRGKKRKLIEIGLRRLFLTFTYYAQSIHTSMRHPAPLQSTYSLWRGKICQVRRRETKFDFRNPDIFSCSIHAAFFAFYAAQSTNNLQSIMDG